MLYLLVLFIVVLILFIGLLCQCGRISEEVVYRLQLRYRSCFSYSRFRISIRWYMLDITDPGSLQVMIEVRWDKYWLNLVFQSSLLHLDLARYFLRSCCLLFFFSFMQHINSQGPFIYTLYIFNKICDSWKRLLTFDELILHGTKKVGFSFYLSDKGMLVCLFNYEYISRILVLLASFSK